MTSHKYNIRGGVVLLCYGCNEGDRGAAQPYKHEMSANAGLMLGHRLRAGPAINRHWFNVSNLER